MEATKQEFQAEHANLGDIRFDHALVRFTNALHSLGNIQAQLQKFERLHHGKFQKQQRLAEELHQLMSAFKKTLEKNVIT